MKPFRTSKTTLYSFLLALMLGLSIWLGTQGKRDACSPYLAGNPRAPSSEYIQTGSHSLVISCNDWLPRQSLRVQLLSLLELVLTAIFVFSALQDVRGSIEKPALERASRWKRPR